MKDLKSDEWNLRFLTWIIENNIAFNKLDEKKFAGFLEELSGRSIYCADNYKQMFLP
jgi:hypothetical protein